MQDRHKLRDDQWEKIKAALPGKKSDPGRTAEDNRQFVEAVMWIGRIGASDFGSYDTDSSRKMRRATAL